MHLGVAEAARPNDTPWWAGSQEEGEGGEGGEEDEVEEGEEGEVAPGAGVGFAEVEVRGGRRRGRWRGIARPGSQWLGCGFRGVVRGGY